MAPARLPLLGMLCMLSSSVAQLTGSLISNASSPEIILATVENTSNQNVSVLALNNMFDVLHNSCPAMVFSDNGTAVPVAASHLMYDGLLYDDLLNIQPGQNFSRRFDLKDYLHQPPGANGTFIIALPTKFKGIFGDDNTGDGDNGTSSLNSSLAQAVSSQDGELSPSQLSDITLSSENITVSLTWDEIVASARRKRYSDIDPVEDVFDVDIDPSPLTRPTPSGVEVDPSCSPTPATKMNKAVRDAGLLAEAATNAATSGGYPLNYFFQSTDGNAVTDIMKNVRAAVNKESGSAHVDVLCEDVKEWCKLKGGRIRGYADNRVVADSDEALARVVMCPSAMRSSENPPPCVRGPASMVTLGYVMLHELMHIDQIDGHRHIGDLEYGIYGCHSLASPANPADPKSNADSYAWLASFAWALGFGNWQGSPCPAKFPSPP